jgi:protoporphyrinogen oxidase
LGGEASKSKAINMHKKFVIVGAGISGLSLASVLPYNSYLILEKEKEVGGLCKTIKKEGFIWGQFKA